MEYIAKLIGLFAGCLRQLGVIWFAASGVKLMLDGSSVEAIAISALLGIICMFLGILLGGKYDHS